jgi:hypothetical protein
VVDSWATQMYYNCDTVAHGVSAVNAEWMGT